FSGYAAMLVKANPQFQGARSPQLALPPDFPRGDCAPKRKSVVVRYLGDRQAADDVRDLLLRHAGFDSRIVHISGALLKEHQKTDFHFPNPPCQYLRPVPRRARALYLGVRSRKRALQRPEAPGFPLLRRVMPAVRLCASRSPTATAALCRRGCCFSLHPW